MNGTSKTRTHRFLVPRMELAQAMPDLQHNQSMKILSSLARKDKSKNKQAAQEGLHPCTSSHVAYMMCLRRYPDTYMRRCDTAASKHAECVKSHNNWKPEAEFDSLQFLEHFKIFAECRRFRKSDPKEILREGATAAIHFVNNNK